MKAVTLWQPWASAIAVGAKSIETRCWETYYRGPLAIHASCSRGTLDRGARPFRAIFNDILETCHESRSLFADQLELDFDTLPFGAVIATCNLVDCLPVETLLPRLNEREIGWGDYSKGRHAWVLRDIKRLVNPIPAKGAQSLWNWQP